MANQMWMGIPTRHMQWVPCPTIDSTITRKRYVERIQFENGGGDARRSPAYQMEYNFNVSGPANEFEGIDAFNKFASGYYGGDLMYVAHPAIFEANMLSAAWASPGLIEAGWPNIYVNEPAFGSTGANSYGQPLRTAVFNVDSTPNLATKTFTIPIPPTHTLHFGVSGTRTGDAVVKFRPINADGSFATTSNATLLDPAASTRMNTTFSGGTYRAVQVYITRTAATVSTISITSMMAQLYKTSVTPTLPTSHIMGAGSTGMMFADDAIVETYSYMYPPRKGISTTLVEVEAWR
jgi:hypothetical protein